MPWKVETRVSRDVEKRLRRHSEARSLVEEAWRELEETPTWESHYTAGAGASTGSGRGGYA
ncbi:MAG TPA: hypothetical protein EYH50_03875 [Pyrodictium delaneyi]|uniref:Uncharacterized protein n=1 Tax=Pyrodictium delaneyi TaxID=1273541 RepID=A0A833EBE5_9CREN|nr:hypothetical protein [Pyrodictium delaneyi]